MFAIFFKFLCVFPVVVALLFIMCMKLYDNPMLLHVCMKMLNLVNKTMFLYDCMTLDDFV